MEESQNKLKLLFNSLNGGAPKAGLYTLMDKERNNRKTRRPECLAMKIDQFEFKKVVHFKYLGINISEKRA